MKIALLAWGSLLWDHRPQFDEYREEWQMDGPQLKLEFSRISRSRCNALTLALDTQNGATCRVAYAFSKRNDPYDAMCDLRCREGTTINNIGVCFSDNSRQQSRNSECLLSVRRWALTKNIDVAIWTDLVTNFENQSTGRKPFSVDNAILHIQALDPEGKAKTAEYMWRAPEFIDTPLRRALCTPPWFSEDGERLHQGTSMERAL